MRTKYHCDSVEFCPQAIDLFACGNYELNDETRVKVGNLYLMQVNNWETNGNKEEDQFEKQLDGSTILTGQSNFKEIQSFQTSAILDLKWSLRMISNKILLGQVDVDGTLVLYELKERKLIPLISKNLNTSQDSSSSSSLGLSLAWNNQQTTTSTNNVAVSLSSGEVAVVDLFAAEEDGSILNRWKAHDYECWHVSFNGFDPNSVYSGGDDGYFRIWDLRSPLKSSVFEKNFTVGVTSVHHHLFNEKYLAVGGYDDCLRILDIRKPSKPLFEENQGGGVWRIKWHPTDPTILATCCMRAGFKIHNFDVSAAENGQNNKLVRTVNTAREKCEPIAYGIDWSFDINDVATTHKLAVGSFYDNRCDLWTSKRN